jgi:hypothetical protein
MLKDRINLHASVHARLAPAVFRHNDHLAVRLAERWVKREGALGGAYRTRPPLVDDWQFTDGEGHVLPVDITTYPDHIECRTTLGAFRVTFLDNETLLVALPPARCGVAFRASLDRAQIDRRGGVLRLTGDIRRNIAYTTNAPMLHNHRRRCREPIRAPDR